MAQSSSVRKYLSVGIAGLLLAASLCLPGQPFSASRADETAVEKTEGNSEQHRKKHPPVTVDEARRQAEVLHSAMHSTLQLVHHRYYVEDEGLPIPAAIVEEIFEDVALDHATRLQWLVVEGQAMNTDHRAETKFEHDAVAALKAGKPAYEQVVDGIYRRAGAIRLTNACLKCHVPDRKSTEDRTAGLIISIPVLKE